jgi:hydrogenase maturation protease
MKPVLVIGLGNPLRRDDGAGARLVEQLGGNEARDTLISQQLLPEHVDLICGRQHVVFVDAAVDASTLSFDPLDRSQQYPAMTLGHSGHPGWLLALCETVYGQSPRASLLRIPAYDLGHGEGFSDSTALAICAGVSLLEAELRERSKE